MHETPCETLVKCKDDTKDRLDSIEFKIDNLTEILEAFNNAKGIVNGFRILSKVFVWLGVTGAAIAGVYHYLKHLGQ